MIRAAGALLWRENQLREIEIGLVHRPKYDDWSLPKGKVEINESSLSCAYREVFEETGFKTRFTRFLGSIDYEESGEIKRVLYWAAQAPYTPLSFIPNEEVDQLKWLSSAEAMAQVTHTSDQEIIRNFCGSDQLTDTLIILRHTKALERGDWDGDDGKRTLSDLGHLQALSLVNKLEPFAIDEIYSSDFVRCVETVMPLAAHRGLQIAQTPTLNEETFEADPTRAVTFANALKQDAKNILICSHNPVIPTIVRGILNLGMKNRDLIKLEPGDAWIVHRVRGEIVGLDYLAIDG